MILYYIINDLRFSVCIMIRFAERAVELSVLLRSAEVMCFVRRRSVCVYVIIETKKINNLGVLIIVLYIFS